MTLRLPCELCACPEPSVPPAALRQFLGMYGTLLTELRGRPRALAEIVHRGGGPPELAVQLLLCFVFGHLWQPDEEAALLDVSERLLSLRMQALLSLLLVLLLLLLLLKLLIATAAIVLVGGAAALVPRAGSE